MDGIQALNTSLFLDINGGPGTSATLILIATFLAKRLVLPLDLLLGALWLWGDEKKRNAVLKAVLVTALALVLNYAIGKIFPTERPFVQHLGHQWLEHAPTPSFPSDHMTIFACVALCFLLAGFAALGAVVFLAGLACGLSRVFLGIHFPFDLLGGLAMSGISYALVQPLWARKGDAVTQGVQSLYRRALALPIRLHWVKN